MVYTEGQKNGKVFNETNNVDTDVVQFRFGYIQKLIQSTFESYAILLVFYPIIMKDKSFLFR